MIEVSSIACLYFYRTQFLEPKFLILSQIFEGKINTSIKDWLSKQDGSILHNKCILTILIVNVFPFFLNVSISPSKIGLSYMLGHLLVACVFLPHQNE